MLPFICLVATILISALGVQSNEVQHIVGGTRAKSCEFPHIVFIIYTRKNGNNYACEGSIIDKQHIVTAAQCMNGPETKVHVLFGSLDKTTMPTWIEVSNSIKHFQYGQLQGTVLNDVAVLKLSQPIRFSACVKPIRMAVVDEKFVGDCRIAGWGRTGFNQPKSHKLMRADVPLMDRGTCKSILPVILYEHVCVGTGHHLDKTACMGDSGAPLTCTSAVDGADVLVGIMSFGRKCESGLAVFSSVAYFNHWINTMIKRLP